MDLINKYLARMGLLLCFDKGGGSSAPAPDPALIAAQIKSMGIQDDVIQRVMANSEQLMPLQKKQLELSLSAADTAQQQSMEDRGYGLERRGQLSTLQNAQIKDAADFNTADRQEQIAQQASEDVGSAFTRGRDQLSRTLASRGVSANSGMALAAMSNQGMAEDMAKASATNGARLAARQEGRALTDKAASGLSGFPTFGLQTTGNAAQFGMAGQSLANQGLAGLNSGLTTASNVAGQMGSNATGMFGAQASYKNAQDQIEAQANASAIGGLGSLGMAAKYMGLFGK